ncbi:hypothetical protein GCM10007304_34700 [Rhodococcoides trifolii]|uniref:Large secreted protein n=1 Tax=Rhodococcoides trifolii TaxID=908250 RepID=A0A917G1I3_9NOCA|nr:hypothetical protein [Rhodococcus trifolii]GGG17657.1 hypothetical protein GCM10007304_34700 [Rhodococcus trifolii]
MRLFALGLLLCFALTGCGGASATDEDDVTTPSPTDLVPTPGAPPVPMEVSDDQVGTEFTVTPTLLRAQTTPFEAWSPLSGNRIAVHFVTGSPECYGADATVVETPSDVTITLRTGTLVSAEDKACIMIAVYGTMVLDLSTPVGDRKVLNGA